VKLAPSEDDLEAAAAAAAEAGQQQPDTSGGADAPVPMQVDGAAAAPSTSGRGPPIPIADVKLPLELNTRVNCRWKDGNYYAVRILERRQPPDWEGPSDAPEAWEYYVHYHRSEWLGRVGLGWACCGEGAVTQQAAVLAWWLYVVP